MIADEVLRWFPNHGHQQQASRAVTSKIHKHVDVFPQSLEQRDAALLHNECSDEA